MNKIVRLENVSFSYVKDQEFIKDMNLFIEKGKYTCVLGANGGGKTTLGKLIGGVIFSDQGDVFIDGVAIRNEHLKEIRKSIGVIFQNPDNQYVATTLKEDIIFGLENHAVSPDKMDEIVTSVANKCGVSDLLNKEPGNMSGGQKQKGAIAGILALNPRILVLDEATSMLDPLSKKEIVDLIFKLKKENDLTVISITHNPNELLLADNVIVMDEGKIVFNDTKEEFFKKDFSNYNIDLPLIMQFERGMGYENFLNEEELFEKLGDSK